MKHLFSISFPSPPPPPSSFFRNPPSLRFPSLYPSDRSIIVWQLTRDETNYGVPKRALRGHSHFVSDVVISSDGQFALSGSWDHTLRLWEIAS